MECGGGGDISWFAGGGRAGSTVSRSGVGGQQLLVYSGVNIFLVWGLGGRVKQILAIREGQLRHPLQTE